MNATLTFLSRPGDHIRYHTFFIALLLTGVFMVATASDLGVIAPLVISLGIYAIFFALAAELLLGLRFLMAHLVARLLAKRIESVKAVAQPCQ